ncbi:UNVERIFIED_CONTAM: hypothetical protein O8I53_06240 [Campylobacter lari]
MLDQPYLLLVNGDNEMQARQNLKNLIGKFKNEDVDNVLEDFDPETVILEEKEIINARVMINEVNPTDLVSDGYLNITFNDGTSYKLFRSFDDILSKDPNDPNEHLAARENYLQIDDAIKVAKADIEKLESSILEFLRPKFTERKTLSDLIALSNKTEEYIQDARKAATLSEELRILENKILEQGRIKLDIENLEKNNSDLQKEIEVLDTQIQEKKAEYDSENDPRLKEQKAAELDSLKQQKEDKTSFINSNNERIKSDRSRLVSDEQLTQ